MRWTGWLTAVGWALWLGACAGKATAPPSSIGASASVAQLPPGAAGPRNDVPGIDNFAKVSDILYRGAQPTRAGFLELRRLGVKTVVSFRALHSDSALMMNTGLKLVSIPAIASHPENEDMLKFLKVVSDPANQPVFVHCQYGSDRTGCAVAVYRIVEQNWTAQAAAGELPAFGYHPVFTEITTYLADFDRPAIISKLATTIAPEMTTP